MNDQTMIDVRDVSAALRFLPKEERLKLQGVIYGMRLALGTSAQEQIAGKARDGERRDSA